MVEHGADVNTVGGMFNTALQAASYQGHYHLVDLLLSKGADVNASGGKSGNALQAACSQACEKVIELLLSHNAKVTSLNHLNRIKDPALKEKLRVAYLANQENVSSYSSFIFDYPDR
uniref:Ankyrin repeat protein n=1 Tax=Psilocybe cubensis TaxID=181762 RepID=A0A8H7XPD2_PSICU